MIARGLIRFAALAMICLGLGVVALHGGGDAPEPAAPEAQE